MLMCQQASNRVAARHPGRPVRSLTAATLALVVLTVFASPARSAERIRFRMIGGVPVAACKLTVGEVSIPANVVLDIGTRAPVVLHQNTGKLLQVAQGDPLTLTFDDIEKTYPVRVAAIEMLEGLSQQYAPQLGEVPAVAFVGLPAFDDKVIRLEFDKGLLTILDADDKTSLADAPLGPGGSDQSPTWTCPFEAEAYGYWLRGSAGEGFDLRVLLKTTAADTAIDALSADLAGAPGGDLDKLMVGGLDLTRYAALRPEDLSGLPKPRPDVVLGTDLLSYFRVTIDVTARRMRLEQVRKPPETIAERAYFVALAEEDAEAVEAFVEAHGEHRLAGEAAENLVRLRLAAGEVDRDAFLRAVRRRARAAAPNRRGSTLLMLSDHITGSGHEDRFELAKLVLTEAVELAKDDLDATASHQVQARLGRIAYLAGDIRQARRHLLSAAFGLPRDPVVNLWMGDLYMQMDKPSRAWSRYLQAALNDDDPSAALKGINRLNNDPEFRQTFTMADAVQLAEGRVPALHPPRRFDPARAGADARPVELVELFTCIDHPPTQAAEMALAGLAEHLEPAGTAFVQYHLTQPSNDPLAVPIGARRAAMYGVDGVPTAVFDGTARLEGGGDDTAAGAVYRAYRLAALSADPNGRPWELTGTLERDGRQLIGSVTVDGPADPSGARLHLLVCEATQMVLGSNAMVFHHHVARSSLTDPNGRPLAGGAQTVPVQLDADALSARLAEQLAAHEREKRIEYTMKPTYVDSRQLRIVAIVQDPASGRVLAAAELAPPADGEVRP